MEMFYSGINHYVKEVMALRKKRRYWSANHKELAKKVYARVKEQIPEAKYYEYEGAQYIITNAKQQKELLKYCESLQDMYYYKQCEAADMMSRIAEEKYE